MPDLVRSLGLAALSMVAAAAASAQTPRVIDMKGTWKSGIELILEGGTPHVPPTAESKPAGKYRLTTTEFTYKSEGQEGRRFWGTIDSANAKGGRQIGSVSLDGKWIYVVGDRSVIEGTIVDSDTIEVCVRHLGTSSAFVGCGVMKRQK